MDSSAVNDYYYSKGYMYPEHRLPLFFVTDPDQSAYSQESKDFCNCQRQLEQIHCKNCGAVFKGRRRLQCRVHPKIIHLMDFDSCTKCGRRL